MTDALLAGLLAGWAVALPLGAIGVLIVREGVEGGFRPAAAAALGVALVDFGYAVVAVVVGSRLAVWLEPYERAVQVVGGLVLLAVVALGMRGLVTAREPSGADAPLPHRRILSRFVALTAVNPLTAVYFLVLATSLGERVSAPADRAAFVLGVLLASLAWQLVLAGAGAILGRRLSTGARVAVSALGYLIVTGYAVSLLVN